MPLLTACQMHTTAASLGEIFTRQFSIGLALVFHPNFSIFHQALRS